MYEHLSPSSARLVSEIVAAADDSPAWGKLWYALGGLLRERAQAQQPPAVDVGSQTIAAPIQFGRGWASTLGRTGEEAYQARLKAEAEKGPGHGSQ